MSTPLPFLGQSLLLAWLVVTILDGRQCSAWDRHPDCVGQQLLDLFRKFQHTPRHVEIVASAQCQPLGVQHVLPHIPCDGAHQMAAHLTDTKSADATAAAAANGAAAAAATSATAANGVRAAAAACGN